MILLPYRTARRPAAASYRYLLTNLVASYDMTDASGARFDDSGNGYFLSESSAVSTAAGVDSGTTAASLASNYLQRTSPEAAFKPEDAEFVIAGWVYFSNTNGTYPRLGIGDPGASGGQYAFYPSRDGNWYWTLRNSANSGFAAVTKSMPAVASVGWHFVMCYHDPAANLIGMSVDGGSFTTSSLSGGAYTGGSSAFRMVDASFTGRLQGWNIWKGSGVIAAVTSAASRAWLYNSGAAARMHYDIEGATRAIVCDGNSLTRGYGAGGANSYPTQLKALMSTAYTIINRGVDSQTTDQMETDAATQIDYWLDIFPSNSILIAWEGSNDIQFGASLATAQSRWNTYFASRVSAGWASNGCKLVACTVIPRGDSTAPKNVIRDDFNAWLRTNYSTYATHLVDLAADSRLQDTGNTTYFDADTIHLTTAGYAVVAELVHAAL